MKHGYEGRSFPAKVIAEPDRDIDQFPDRQRHTKRQQPGTNNDRLAYSSKRIRPKYLFPSFALFAPLR
jgi:hypothetical protein